MTKKLIEVALPLEAINKASAREKSIRHGNPSTLHLWWARRPLAACRAVLFASLVDDPSSHPELFPTEDDQEKERQRLFRLIEELVKWENSNNEAVLEKARTEIRKYAGPDGPPPVLDPFCGGGSIPLEAQRLGLEAYASDLNPVAVLITKALIEIPPKFTGQAPVNPGSRKDQSLFSKKWKAAHGLAEDVRHYGQWMRGRAFENIGHLYPTMKVTKALLSERQDIRIQGFSDGDELTVIAWLWARTVPSPSPAARGVHIPLVRSFWLSKKKGKEVWIEPVIDTSRLEYRFTVCSGKGGPKPATYEARKGGTCLLTGSHIPMEYLRDSGKRGNLGSVLLAIVAEGKRGRIYLEASDAHSTAANEAKPTWSPADELPDNPRWFSPPIYGMKTFADLFTSRQLVALTTFSDLVSEARKEVFHDGREAGIENPEEYADAVATYLAFAVDKSADYWCTIATWATYGFIRGCFARQAIPMTWDFAETNPFSGSTGNWNSSWGWGEKVLIELPETEYPAVVSQRDARSGITIQGRLAVSTDPPYYDNIGYADLSDFFYIWLRRSLQRISPEVFQTLLTPKADEMIASPYRHNGDSQKAAKFFEDGLLGAFENLRSASAPEIPTTVYYAFKQAEYDQEGGVASTGWDTMLSSLLTSGFTITGTWPLRTERQGRSVSLGTNALASSVVLSCRHRPDNAPRTTRLGFLKSLKAELPAAIKDLQRGNIAPVDLAQASIGPGMAIFSRYSEVLEPDGSPMTVRTALALINQTLDEFQSEQEGDFDPDTRWALDWYRELGFQIGDFGRAELLSKAKNTSVSGLVESGILEARAGKARLLKRSEMSEEWDPAADKRLTVWEATQHLIRMLEKNGESAAAGLLIHVNARQSGLAETARELAYRLYSICERKKWAEDALAYNMLVTAWPEIERLAVAVPAPTAGPQTEMDF